MIYKNCILGKKLSGLDIYISIFCLLLLSLLEVFFIIIIINTITSLVFFCKLWRLVNANCNFCVFIFCIIFTLIWLVLIRNICYLLTYLLLTLFCKMFSFSYDFLAFLCQLAATSCRYR